MSRAPASPPTCSCPAESPTRPWSVTMPATEPRCCSPRSWSRRCCGWCRPPPTASTPGASSPRTGTPPCPPRRPPRRPGCPSPGSGSPGCRSSRRRRGVSGERGASGRSGQLSRGKSNEHVDGGHQLQGLFEEVRRLPRQTTDPVLEHLHDHEEADPEGGGLPPGFEQPAQAGPPELADAHEEPDADGRRCAHHDKDREQSPPERVLGTH